MMFPANEEGDHTHVLLRLAHGLPTALAFLLHSALGSIGTKISRDDGTGGLHVQEVGR